MSAKVPLRTKAAAIADLKAGEQPAVVAERYGLDAAKVRVWKQRYVTADQAIVTPPVTDVAPIQPSVEARKRQIGELVLDLLAAKLEASEAIAKAASNPAWLAEQSGSELAALGSWLDATAFAIGDRLAQRPGDPAQQPDD